MTYQDAIKKTKKWYKRVTIITLYHNKRVLANPKWNQRMTAQRLGISLGAVNEAIKLSLAMVDNPELQKLSRNEALKRIRK